MRCAKCDGEHGNCNGSDDNGHNVQCNGTCYYYFAEFGCIGLWGCDGPYWHRRCDEGQIEEKCDKFEVSNDK